MKVWKLDGALAPRESLRLKVTQIGATMDFFFTLVTLALSELEETHTGVMTLERNISVLCSYQSYCGQEYTQGHAQALR